MGVQESITDSRPLIYLLFFHEQHAALHMIRMREHIHRLHFERLIPAILKHPQVSCKGAWIAGHIHHPLRFHVDDCPQEGFVAALSWRVNDEGVGRDAFYIP